MSRAKGLIIACLLATQSVSAASTVNFINKGDVKRVKIDLFSELAFFSGETTLLGYGVGVGMRYALNDDFAIGITLSQALAFDGGIAALYSGIRALGHYAIFGKMTHATNALYYDDKLVLTQDAAFESLFYVTGGLSQYLFNGSASVAPASGLTAGVGYEFQLWGLNVNAAFLSGMLILNRQILLPLVGNLGIYWAF